MEIKLGNAVAIAAAAVVAAAAAYYWMRPTEEARVKAAFARAAETISKEDGESLIVTATRAKDIADLVADKFQVVVEEQHVDETITPSETARQVTAVRATCSSLSVRFEDIRVDSINGDVAHATADLLVSGTGMDAFMSGRDTREVDAKLVKSPEDGKWRFSFVSIDAIVER